METSKQHARNIVEALKPFIIDGQGIEFNYVTEIGLEELLNFSTEKLTRGYLISKLVELSKNEELTYDKLEENIAKDLKSEKEKKTWILLIPLNIDINKRKIRFYDREIRIRSVNSILKEYKGLKFTKKTGLGELYSKNLYLRTKKVLEVEIVENTIFEAWARFSEEFQILRGIVDFIFEEGGWKINPENQTRANLYHPDIIYGLSDEQEYHFIEFVNLENNEKKIAKSIKNNKQKENLDYILELLSKTPKKNSIESLISDCYRLYSNSMDSLPSRNGFVGFWQLAESICISDRIGGQTKFIVNRMNWFASATVFPIRNIQYTLKAFASKRNLFVHRGIVRFDQHDLNILKLLCERAMIWLIRNSKDIKTINQLEIFYRLTTSNKQELMDYLKISKMMNER